MKRALRFLIPVAICCSFVTSLPAFNEPSSEVGHGLAQLERGRLEEAEAALARARFLNPDDPRILYDLGIVQFRKRDYAAAAKTWERSVTQADPSLQADGFHNLGNARYRMGSWAEAIAAYERSLALEEDPRTRFNLEQARKRMQDEQREQSQNDQKQEGQPQDSQGKDQQGQSGKDQQSKDQRGQDNSQDKNGENAKKQPGKDEKQGNPEQDGKEQANKDSGKPPSDEGRQNGASETADPGRIGSATPEMGGDDKERKDLAMKDGQDAPPPPKDVSEGAKAMKDKRINPYLVEKVLKELEEREREIQLRYRRDPQQARRDEDMDPFMMDPEQLRDFFERRGRPQAPQQQESPDW